MKLVVTGASGFIGRVVARRLTADGHDVTAIIGRSAPPSDSAAHYVRADFADEALAPEVRDAVTRADAIAHLAATRKVWGVAVDTVARVNVQSGVTLVRHARPDARFVLLSSAGVHGCTNGAVVDETSRLAPYDTYGVSKVKAERAVAEAACRSGVHTTILRPGIVYGPGDTYGMVTNMARLIAARRFLIVGGGKSRVQLLHVADAAAAVCAALVRPEAAGQTLLVSGTEAVTLRELAHELARRLGSSIPPLRVPEKLARSCATFSERMAKLGRSANEPFLTHAKLNLITRDYVYDTSKAEAVLGFRPAVPLERGLDELVRWFTETGGTRRESA